MKSPLLSMWSKNASSETIAFAQMVAPGRYAVLLIKGDDDLWAWWKWNRLAARSPEDALAQAMRSSLTADDADLLESLPAWVEAHRGSTSEIAANPRQCTPADPDAELLGKWATQPDSASGREAASAAARRLADKRWKQEKRLQAKLLR